MKQKLRKPVAWLLTISLLFTMLPGAALAAEAEHLCSCDTDDESIHATTCAAYVQPENPVCYCAEQCTEANEWCDVCGFDYTACTGTEEATSYFTNPTGKDNLLYNGEAQVLINAAQTDSDHTWWYCSYGSSGDPIVTFPDTSDPPTATIVDRYTVNCYHVDNSDTEDQWWFTNYTKANVSLTVYIYPVVSTDPVAATGLVANGTAKTLITSEGRVSGGYGGDVLYSVTDASAMKPGSFSTAQPTATEPGTYKVWFKAWAQGPERPGYSRWGITAPDSAARSITVTVADPNACPHEVYKNGFCDCGAYQPAELKNGYYQISNGGQLFWFAQQVNVKGNREIKGVLTADIDLENKSWTPIGSTGENSNNFRGHFDGQGHTIEGLYVDAERAGVGFFGEVRTGTVENFTIYGEVVMDQENNYVGGVIGSACGLNSSDHGLERNGATIRNITSYVNLTAGAHGIGMVGGFIGYANHESLIENCAWYGTFDAGIYRVDSGAGGFVGKIQENSSEVTIRNCGAYGTIKTNYAGDYNNNATIYMGGFLSFSNTNAQTTLENCLFAGRFERGENLTDQAFLGAFGTLRSVNAIKNCYYLGDDGLAAVHSDSNLKPGSDNVEIISVSTAQLLSGEIAYLLQEANEVWGQDIGTDDYPVLGGETVYYGYDSCADDAAKVYTNVSERPSHSYTNGFCSACDSYEPAADSDSDGYYEISNAGQLYWFAAQVNGGNKAINGKLMENITVNENVLNANGELNSGSFRVWTPIGNEDKQYSGTFDGNGKTVSGLYYNNGAPGTANQNIGLFGVLNGAAVQDVSVSDSYLYGFQKVSGIAGVIAGSSTITGCTNSATVGGASLAVGGIVGSAGAGNSSITDCTNTGSITGGKNTVGGIAGSFSSTGRIANCTNTGSITGGNNNVGGIAGYFGSGTAENCYNTGSVGDVRNEWVGGIAGHVGLSGIVNNCYNTGAVSGNSNVGGVAGYNYGSVTNSYYNSSVYSGNAIGAGGGTVTNVEGKTTEAFASGEVAYLLNGDQSTITFKQTIGEDAYPNFTGKTVYAVTGCNGASVTGYSNTEGEKTDHAFGADGKCTNDGCTAIGYDLWVGGEQFTSEKLTISGTTGTATYDPGTNTLTLNNYSYTGEGYEVYGAAIYYGGSGTLELVLVNDNTVTHTDTTYTSYGIYAEGGITISGTGSLSATGGNFGVYVYGDLTLGEGIGILTPVGGRFDAGKRAVVDAAGNIARFVEIKEKPADPVVSVKISAVDATYNRVLADAHLQILNTAGEVIVIEGKKVEWDSGIDPEEITGLKAGETYFIRTTVAPEEYLIPAATKFTIDQAGNITPSGTVTNGVIPVRFKKTVVQISAVDAANDAALEGAYLQILEKAGVQVVVKAEWDSTTEVYKVEGLKTGMEYTLHAVDAPDGYLIPADTEFTIGQDGTITTTGITTTSGVLLVKFNKIPDPDPVKVQLKLTKQFNGWGKADGFTFNLAAVTEHAPMPASPSAKATLDTPLACFGEITFTAAGTYEYTITEVDSGIPGVTYDTSAHEVVVTIKNTEDNKLIAEVKYDGEESLTITNTYTEATRYPLWIGGTQVTSHNAADVFGDGTVSYDAKENTLTLHSYTYEGPGYTWENSFGSSCGAAIYYGDTEPLNLILKGDSTVTHTGNENLYRSYGLYANGNVVVNADSLDDSLTITGGAATYGSYGVCLAYDYENSVGGELTLNSGSLIATGGEVSRDYYISYGLHIGRSTVINGGSIIAKAKEQTNETVKRSGMVYGESITFAGGFGILTPVGGKISYGDILDSSDEVADYVEIGAGYTVTAAFDSVDEKNVGGTVSGAGFYRAGANVTLTITPDTGCELKSVTAVSDGSTVNGTLSGSTYTFTMPENDVAVTVTMERLFTPYDLWVGGEQFTDKNLTISDGKGGTATYDYASTTLTLDGYTYEGAGHTWEEAGWGGTPIYYGAAIYYSGTETLNLILKGDSSVTHTGSADMSVSYGLYAKGNAVVNADSLDDSLTITGGAANDSHGVYAGGSITLSDGSLTATGGTAENDSYGVCANGSIEVSGSLTATGGTAKYRSYGVHATGSITVPGSLTATGGTSGGDSYGVYANGSITVSGSLHATGGTSGYNSYGVCISGLTMGEGIGILTPVGGRYDEGWWAVVDADGNIATEVVIGIACDHSGNENQHTDCTVDLICSVCGEVVTEAAAAHIPGADDGDCTTAIKCTVCGTVTTPAKEAHTPGADDGDCTTAVKCTVCDKNAVEGKTHSDGEDKNHACDNSGCTVDNVDGGHHGGTATCVAAAVCAECGQSYGALGGHTGELQWIQTPATHKQIYVCCGAVVVNEASHNWGEDNVCTICRYGCAHTYENPVFVWQADFSAAKMTVTCGSCEDVKELNCEISSQWDADTLTFTATAGEGAYTDTQTIQLAVVGGKLTIANSAAAEGETVEMIIMVAGYTGGRMTGCQVIEDVTGVIEQTIEVSGDTIKIFFLNPETYEPLFACAEL